MSKNIKLYKLVLAAIFSALAFVGTMINVPLPSGGLVHLGNFVMILAALLCGGIVGGISGSLGMGLFDIAYGYAPSSIVRTFILKFIIGFIVGTLFRLIIKKKINTNIISYVFTGVFLAVSVCLLIMLCNSTDGAYTVVIAGSSKAIKFVDLLLATIFACVFFIGFLAISVFSRKLKFGMKACVFAMSIGMLTNMILEFCLRIFLTHFMDAVSWPAATATAIAKIPSSILTALITVVFGAVIYKYTYKASKEINYLNDMEVDI